MEMISERGMEKIDNTTNTFLGDVMSQTEKGNDHEVGDMEFVTEEENMENDNERVQLISSEELKDYQDSTEKFAKSVGLNFVDVDLDGGRRRCGRLKEKEDKNVLEMATERKEAKNAFINKEIGGKSKKSTMGANLLRRVANEVFDPKHGWRLGVQRLL